MPPMATFWELAFTLLDADFKPYGYWAASEGAGMTSWTDNRGPAAGRETDRHLWNPRMGAEFREAHRIANDQHEGKQANAGPRGADDGTRWGWWW